MQAVTISDNLQTAVAAYVGGTVLQVQISWTAFTASDGSSVAAGNQIVAVSRWGNFNRQFVPNSGATPATDYNVAYTISVPDLYEPAVYTEQWVIPSNAGNPLLVEDCRVTGILTGPSGQGSVLVPIGLGNGNTGGNPGNGATIYTGSQSITSPPIPDGICTPLAQTVTVQGAVPGRPASVGVSPALPAGFTVSAQITSANIATITLCNLSGEEQAPATATYTVSVA